MIPLFTSQQVRSADRFAIEKLGLPGTVLMENAARSILEQIKSHFVLSEKMVFGIVAGKGNNGGDGFALARQLLINGYRVNVVALADDKELKGDALLNFEVLKNLIKYYPDSKLIKYKKLSDLSVLNTADVIVDAILGTGSKGELREPYKSIVEKLNTIDAYKVAIDLPTGLDVDTGYGSVVFNADLTVALSEYKSGLFYGRGYTHCGKVVKGSIGIGSEYYNQLETDTYLIEPEDAFLNLPEKKRDVHKYSAGKVLLIAGSKNLPGAAVMASESALRAGAGAVVLAVPDSIAEMIRIKLGSAIVFSYNDDQKGFLIENALSQLEEKIKWADAIAIGPGLGHEPETINAVIKILKSYSNKKFVIDADAIIALKNSKLELKNCILTPHTGEFANLVSVTIEELKSDLIPKAKKFALTNKCHLVLKGAPTIIFNPAGEVFINTIGNQGMAKFGTGDILTGLVASFVAQSSNIEASAIAGVYLHSLAADLLAQEKTIYGFTANDITEKIPYAIKFIIDTFLPNIEK
ncbi:NAD(P)H-hydrate dehydratase [Melioribacter sp. OK-6-Me]|uniref:NAD(P)H-hydrate dehydratase n=1 Tax=unclassified Melioribacter TaxID=2627329 RepID=UPI003ED8EE2F